MGVLEARPLLIVGAQGTLGTALVHACRLRGLAFVALNGRSEGDIADSKAVSALLNQYHPWAVVNAAGYVNVAAAESDRFECFRSNVKGPAVLARACARRGIRLIVFSSAMVFNGGNSLKPSLENDTLCPVGVYARSKAQMERDVLQEMSSALIIRCSALFGPWDTSNFLTEGLRRLAEGRSVRAASDEYLTPAYLPDLVDRVLDLLIDGETGPWHLGQGDNVERESDPAPVSRWEIIRRAAKMAGVIGQNETSRLLRDVPYTEIAPQGLPCCSVLASERSTPLLPPLDWALRDYVHRAKGLWTPVSVALPPQAKQMAGASVY